MPKKGYKQTEEHKKNTGLAMQGKKNFLGKHHTDKSRTLMSIHMKGRIPWNYIDGRSKIKKGNKRIPLLTKEQRKENKKRARKIYKYSMKNAGKLTKEIIQRVYEDNIKKFGTLTCYLCKNRIVFENDNLEHKTPLSRGGTNNYENLGISCKKCNFSKHDKTEEEYLKIIERRQEKKG